MTRSSRAPLITLGALLAAAGAVLTGGILVAKRTITEHREVGREELAEFAGVLTLTLKWLDARYEQHLSTLAERIPRRSEIAMRAAGDHLVGLRQISIVPKQGRGLHAEYPGRGGMARVPLPVLVGNGAERTAGRERFELDTDDASGWEGDWFYQYRFDLDAYVVTAVDRAEVMAATRGWIAEWYPEKFEAVAATGAAVRLDAPDGGLREAGTGRDPDFVLPLKTRFGRWRLAAWDEITTSTDYHPPTLAAASVLACGLVLLGGLAFSHQRKWQRLAEQRVSFVNRVSHELRTPLTNILLNADLASETMETSPRDATRRLGLLREEAGRLSRLIGNVLSFSKNERGELKLAAGPVPLGDLVEATLATFRPALRRRGIEVELDVDADIAALGDADACAQILANLVSNVEKYAASGAWMGISAGPSPEGVWLAVSDRGPRDPARLRGADLRRLRTPRRTHRRGGQRHRAGAGDRPRSGAADGGRPGLRAGRGRGALRVEPPARPGERRQHAAQRGLMRILVAEDDPVLLESLSACLAAEGFDVAAAADGARALELWEGSQPDLLCLDIMMPEVDGYEVCRRVRAKDGAVPILFLSAKSEEIDIVVGLELGADDFLRKPFGTREFLARVRAALRRTCGGGAGRARAHFEMASLRVYPRELRAELGGGAEIDLSPREVKILQLLHERSGEAVHRDELLDRAWGLDYYPESRTLDQHIAKLRKRIEHDPAEPQIIETVRGVGYRFRG